MRENNNYIIGTAGHVDHGKSSLIKIMTGIDPDRLPQEKARKLTLDLGFAHVNLPSGIECGIIDVPGHEKYLKNMLSGVGGYDFALLVVDAGEGIKEQTREHLDIMQLLEIKDGITVITKIDRVDPETVDQVESELIDFLKDSFLCDSPIVRFSAPTGEGLDTLLDTIDQRINLLEPRPIRASLRLPIDRVFLMPGVGVVVTGTIHQGQIRENRKIEILPAGLKAKVRQIQVHNVEVKKAYAGQRVALNIAGVEKADIERGDWIITPRTARATGRMDVSITLLKSAPQPLKNDSEVRLYNGTAEIFAQVYLLDRDVLEPGEKTYAQVSFQESATVFAQDKFIIRTPSSLYTWGGGKIIEPYPGKHRRFDKRVIELLKVKESGDSEILLDEIMQNEPYILHSKESIAGITTIRGDEMIDFLRKMEDSGKLISMTADKYLHSKLLERFEDQISGILESLEEIEPYRLGTKFEEIKKNMPKMEDRMFREIMIDMKNKNKIKEKDALLSSFDFTPHLTGRHEECRQEILRIYKSPDFTPPTIDELKLSLDYEGKMIGSVLDYMIFTGELIALDEKIIIFRENIDRARIIIGNYIVKNDGITPGEARNLLKSTRKYIIPLLEYFDRVYFTKRKQNKRILFRTNVYVDPETEDEKSQL
ncbi:MAG: selenocysteine-specific translation elongation factor [Candidatus Eremiobacteraeota bacterium]|nr:selenocysteine-specific translation elongation factor [Candidatus Eremiobacteraeota bacterium]